MESIGLDLHKYETQLASKAEDGTNMEHELAALALNRTRATGACLGLYAARSGEYAVRKSGSCVRRVRRDDLRRGVDPESWVVVRRICV